MPGSSPMEDMYQSLLAIRAHFYNICLCFCQSGQSRAAVEPTLSLSQKSHSKQKILEGVFSKSSLNFT